MGTTMDRDEPVLEEGEQQRVDAEHAALPYRWRQTLQDLSISVPVPQGTRSRDLQVSLMRSKLSVGLKGKDPILHGELFKDIRVDDSTWTLEDAKEVSIQLEKQDQQAWWPHVVTSAPRIDTTKIQPENSQLSDLDPETRAMVEKMMFDNQQKQLGKPTSDDLQKAEMLRKFQEQHPEMDFSKAKVG